MGILNIQYVIFTITNTVQILVPYPSKTVLLPLHNGNDNDNNEGRIWYGGIGKWSLKGQKQ